MVVNVNEIFEESRYVKNKDKSKKYILRGEKNVRYHDRIPSKKRNLIISHNFLLESLPWK